MGYDVAVSKAWSELENLSEDKKKFTVYFLGDNYDIELSGKIVISRSCNVLAKDYTAVLILHYLAKSLKDLPALIGEWISFKELPGGQGYYPAFKKRVIDRISRKYGSKPEALLDLPLRFEVKKTQLADVGIVLNVFKNVPILITCWRGDDEFGPEVNVLFDKGITDIFCTEDIVVLAESAAHRI